LEITLRTIVPIGANPLPRRTAQALPAADLAARVPDETRLRLLDAAERLFAERGFEGTSMRVLADRAGTSVSAAHYHFGGKLELVRAVLLRRLEPLNARRLGALQSVLREAAPGCPTLEAVLDAFLRPGVEAWRGRDAMAGGCPRHILAQLHVEPDTRLAELKAELFGPVVERFAAALATLLPDRSRDEIRLDMQFVVGMLVHVVGGQVDDCGSAGRPAAIRVDDEILLGRMVTFAAAGLRARSLRDAGARGPETRR
jgi:AcrR family transcriptional regulator